ncbi:MsnO8 family LLM class oxidoreductase [Paracoccus aminophilus]|uniref:Monooxygenase n=1 Tax=Paracoccus aminophilus JCM 7686 TaxID=1367847 RepID=S5YHC2_PARAH|nr:MsnO8 family LLM class oxidoreductase [Paracoccus aminophilus]AGT10863.1 monooxygenase [Paracoccus aminophilus JCM 7686]
MSYRIGLLDKSPLDGAEAPEAALARTVSLAKTAEKLGYSRFWVAEHHNSPTVSGPAPEVLVAYLLAQTSRIRIGSGGVMLNHYSPYKVAEVFRLLAALAPGRVDLGVGKAAGGGAEASRALRQNLDEADLPDFPAKLADLSRYLQDRGESEDDSLLARPIPTTPPERYLLGASEESALLAARHGWRLVYAAHIDGGEARFAAVTRSYREASGRAPILALTAVAAADAAKARALAGDLMRYRLIVPGRQRLNFGSREAAKKQAAALGARDYQIEELTPQAIFGTAEDIHAHLGDLNRRYGIEEFIVDCPVSAAEARRESVIRLGEAHAAQAPAPSVETV